MTARSAVFMFSGQGSQYFQMGRELYANNPRFRSWMMYCDEIAHGYLDHSLLAVIYGENEKSQPFDHLLYSSPALLSIHYSLSRLLVEAGIEPRHVLGYSLGELSAATIAGVIPLENAFQFMIESAKLVATESPPAKMIAILDSIERVNPLLADIGDCWVTAHNFERNVVVTGKAESMQMLCKLLQQQQMIFHVLPVNFGFHTELIDPLKSQMLALAQRLSYDSPRITLQSSALACPITEKDQNFDWPQHFWQVLRGPIQFNKLALLLLQKGNYDFIDVGPSGTLATFIKYLAPTPDDANHFSIMTPFGKDVKTLENTIRQLPTQYSNS